ncbi:MAG: hypothetical protein COA60_004680 [Robiginitomaculum sp.]|nr:hypothetical protein [Robiginitomaculum sp.]
MLRFTLIEILFLGLPLAIFLGYRAFLIHHRKVDREEFSPVPYHKLFVAGGVAALLAYFVMAFSNEKITDQKYVPAHIENGKLIPGGFVEREEPKTEEKQ